MFSLVLSLSVFFAYRWLQNKLKSNLISPILFGGITIIGIIKLLGISNAEYQAGCAIFSWLLTPATVCLAVPLYEQVKILRKSLKAILIGVVSGTLASLLFVGLMCALMIKDDVLTASLLPKSITTAMGIVLSAQNGGSPAITAIVICITGNLGSIMCPTLSKLFKLDNPISEGVAFGTATHVMGTAVITEKNPLSGAASGLSLVVAGLLTAIILTVV